MSILRSFSTKRLTSNGVLQRSFSDLLSSRFSDYFAQLDDPRHCYGNKRHELSDVLVLTILAVISGAESWVEVEEFGYHKEAWLKEFLQPFSLIRKSLLRSYF
jgi:hypothetical protein